MTQVFAEPTKLALAYSGICVCVWEHVHMWVHMRSLWASLRFCMTEKGSAWVAIVSSGQLLRAIQSEPAVRCKWKYKLDTRVVVCRTKSAQAAQWKVWLLHQVATGDQGRHWEMLRDRGFLWLGKGNQWSPYWMCNAWQGPHHDKDQCLSSKGKEQKLFLLV